MRQGRCGRGAGASMPNLPAPRPADAEFIRPLGADVRIIRPFRPGQGPGGGAPAGRLSIGYRGCGGPTVSTPRGPG